MPASEVSTGRPPSAPGEGAERRLLGRVGRRGGPLLVCVGGLHGNEPAGVHGLRQVLERLETDPTGLEGELVALLGNRRALAAGKRYLARDLNRMWVPARLERLRAGAAPECAEDEELLEIDRWLQELLGEAAGVVHVLDLHTTSASGPPFAVLDDTLANRAFALAFEVPLVLGLEEELEGPLLHYLVDRGVVCSGFESGQHGDPDAVTVAAAAVWVALESSGVLRRESRPEVIWARQRLAAAGDGLPEVTEVVYRHGLGSGDDFTMAPGFEGFEPVHQGEELGWDRSGQVTAPESGRILMPLYQRQGDDGYFIVRDVHPVFLRLSALMRRLRLERIAHWLPGVRRVDDRPATFVVDRRVARWLALEVFHLLGFRRHGAKGEQVVFSRRAEP